MKGLIEKFENLKIAKKLSVCMAIVLALFVVSSLATVFQLIRIGNELQEVADGQNSPHFPRFRRLREAITKICRATHDVEETTLLMTCFEVKFGL